MGKLTTAAIENASVVVAGTLSSAASSGNGTTGSGFGKTGAQRSPAPSGGTPGNTVAPNFYDWFNATLSWSNFVGSVQLERSFDGSSTYQVVTEANSGSPAVYTGAGAAFTFSTSFYEPELGVLYRFRVTAYTSGSLTYRISQ